MIRYQQLDPKDIGNPVDVIPPKGTVLVYHGTSSNFAERIEAVGFVENALPYDFEDVLLVKRAHETLQFSGLSGGGIPVLGVFSTGSEDEWVGHKRPSFASDFQHARNYSTIRGGETIDSLLTSIEEFGEFVENPQLLAANAAKLERDAKRFPPGDAWASRMRRGASACKDAKVISNLTRMISPIYQKYMPLRVNHKPVVFAVACEPGRFDPPAGPFGVNLRAVTDLEPDSIVARVDFPNGAEYVDIVTELGPDGTPLWVASKWQRNRAVK
jgi:hypothetical protein